MSLFDVYATITVFVFLYYATVGFGFLNDPKCNAAWHAKYTVSSIFASFLWPLILALYLIAGFFFLLTAPPPRR